MPILSMITWIPLAGAVIILLLPGQRVRLIQGVALVCATLSLLLAWSLLLQFEAGTAALQFTERQ